MTAKPNTPSSDHAAMAPYWAKVTAVLGGSDAMREAGETYLPRFNDETRENYENRRKSAKFTAVFGDIIENLSQRPFSAPVGLADGEVPQEIEDFAKDVDGRGNSLHTFAGEVFNSGIAYAVDWILSDYTPDVPQGATVAVERSLGARPFWRRYGAESVLAAYSDQIGGKEEFVHVRLWEPTKVRDGFGEATKDRVRILDRAPLEGGGYGPATWALWERKEGAGAASEWFQIGEPAPLTIGVIPLVPFITGRRSGGSWVIRPPMRDAADLQVELFQQESALKYAKTMTAFPMLAGNGVEPQTGDNGDPMPVPVGPHRVLYAPPYGESGQHGSWEFIEPSSESLRFLASDIEATISQMRELGRQPLTAQSGNLTVVTTAVAAQKGNAAIQAWALNLKDALENALAYTAMWLKAEGYEPRVSITKDFDLGIGDDDTFEHVLKLRESEEISREAAIHEAKRRGILDADYDGDDDLDTILDELAEGDGPETATDADADGRIAADAA